MEGLACRLFAERAESSEIASLSEKVRLLEEAVRKRNIRNLIQAKNRWDF